MKTIFRFLFFLVLLALFSCANQVAPTGGDKDVKPPKPLKQIPENYSTNFKGHEITINFDEYIQLKDISTQLVVSPPLKYPVKTKVRQKSLLIEMEDTLHQNATYTLNFGNSIVDNHEGNALENFQYVFSTGDVIDSLIVSGKIEQAFTKKTEKGLYVMLYHGKDDSLPLKKIPDYFAKTNDSGFFQIRNVSPGDYKIVALKDNNSNYLFDNNDETVAFTDSAVVAPATGITMELFKELPRQQLVKSSGEEAGKAVVVYSRPLQEAKVYFLSNTDSLKIYSSIFSPKNDSLIIWYRNQLSDSLSLIIQHTAKTETVSDTVTIRLRRSDSSKGRFKYVPALTTQYESKSEMPLELGHPLELIFNHPVEQYDFKNISLTEDSIEIKKINLNFKDSLKRTLTIDYNWKEKAKYNLIIPKGTLIDIFGIKNDSLEYTFKTKSLADFGTLALKIQLPVKVKQYLIQLIPVETGDKENVYRQAVIHSDTTLHYEYLDPRIYRFKLIEDVNANGEWDTGSYLLHQQPERISYYKENITVRANWDVEVKWKVE